MVSENKIKFLIIVQDLRISGTSEGLVSRSFIGRIREVYPNSIIDVVYIKNHENEDDLNLLPIDNLKKYYISPVIPKRVIWLNKIWWRFTGSSLNDKYKIDKYRRVISEIDHKKYDHIFLRSSGQEFETIRGAKGLPILNKTIVNFHDPYPVYWDTGSKRAARKIEFAQFREILSIVTQAKRCMSPSKLLSHDLSYLYGSSKRFYVLPHQYVPSVFRNSKDLHIRKKEREVCISYHGALQLGRNIEGILQAYLRILQIEPDLKDRTELVLRLKGAGIDELKSKYYHPNIIFLNPVELAISIEEQHKESDILLILESCTSYSNILVGKAPLLASFNKPVLALSPRRSEMRRIIKDEKFYAQCNDVEEIKQKLGELIENCLNKKNIENPFGDYFDLPNFKKAIKEVIK